MKHALIRSADIRLAYARKLGDRCGRLLYFCPCGARLVAAGFTAPDIVAFRAHFGGAKRAQGEMVFMECGPGRLSACLAMANGLQLIRE